MVRFSASLVAISPRSYRNLLDWYRRNGFDAIGCCKAPAIGAGQRPVLVQFRGKKVILHCAGYTDTIKRDTFKQLVASNRRYRKRNQPTAEVIPFPTRPTVTKEAA